MVSTHAISVIFLLTSIAEKFTNNNNSILTQRPHVLSKTLKLLPNFYVVEALMAYSVVEFDRALLGGSDDKD